jgi:hypothetical protein
MRVPEIQKPIAFSGGWHAQGELAQGVARLTDHILAAEAVDGSRRRRRRSEDAAAFRRGIDAIACNLALVNAAAPGRALAIRRGKFARSACPDFGAPFNIAVDVMVSMGLVCQAIGYRGTATTITMLAAMADYLPAALMPEHLSLSHSDLIELRACKAEWDVSRQTCTVPDSPEVQGLRKEMEALVAWLTTAPVTYDGPAFWLRERDPALAVVAARHGLHLRRIFNNGSLEHGGRIFGGWWQLLPARDRLARIQIQGERVIELDFRAMVPRLCYARLRVPWPFSGNQCPYTPQGRHGRDAWKKLTNAMLASGGPLRSWPGDTIAAQHALRDALDIPLCEAAAAIRAHHPNYTRAGGFGRRLSTKAMRLESDIAVQVVLRLRDRGVVVLPIHDGFLAPASKAGLVSAVMREAAMAVAGVDLKVTAKG